MDIALHQVPAGFHGDPADRLIVATGLAYGLVLATHDQAIRSSEVIAIWTGSRLVFGFSCIGWPVFPASEAPFFLH